MLDGKGKNSKYPLLYHITPPEGLLNDPNGLIKYKDLYHVFYQWNSKGTEHKYKTWGHVTSSDLIHWKRHEAALVPSEEYDKDGIYSGSAIVKDGRLYLFYTGNVIDDTGEKHSCQCLAISDDGFKFEKLGPIMKHPSGYTRHVRDPKVWLGRDNSYWLVLGAQRCDLRGEALLYQSDDLYHWDFKGPLIKESQLDLGYMWECPDLMEFQGDDVFVFSPQGLEKEEKRFDNEFQTGYISGKFTSDGQFNPGCRPFAELDRGFEFYAPQTFKDEERTIMFGWIGQMPHRIEQEVPTISEGWIHCLSIPRELSVTEGVVQQKPVKELESLRKSMRKYDRMEMEYSIELENPYAEIIIDFSGEPEDFEINISGVFQIRYQESVKEVILERNNWLDKKKDQRIGELKKSLKKMHIFLDGSTIEMFINEGILNFSNRYFKRETLKRNIHIKDPSMVSSVTVYQLEI